MYLIFFLYNRIKEKAFGDFCFLIVYKNLGNVSEKLGGDFVKDCW